jgi:hypothetical protein
MCYHVTCFLPGAKVIKLFSFVTDEEAKKLECFLLFSLIQYLQMRPELIQVEHLVGAPFRGRLLALLANIRSSGNEPFKLYRPD